MDTFDFNNLNSDSLMVITSVCAIIISIISMTFTVIFSILQVKHNKNSVRPISAIKFNDYENNIEVKIGNVGTGPLIIRRLVFRNSVSESSALISMMPNINQLWDTFTETADGWTIPAGGQLIILKICPKTDEVRKLIRKELSAITAFIEYTDIYNTKFYDERSLAFFGRLL